MSASKLHPKVWQGKEDSSGYIARNDKPTSRSSPGFRGRVYVSDAGWHWVSGWVVDPQGHKKGMLNLKLRGMTDQEAQQYCAPKGANYQRPPPAATGSQSGPTQESFGDDDIPF